MTMLISIVIPMYNEKENVKPLLASIRKEEKRLAKRKIRCEIVVVDDGSTDGTFQELLAAKRRGKRLRIIRFRRNYGQTPAFDAGFSHSKGEIVVTMDGDLQNDPSDIGRLLKELERGFDVVSGWRFDRKDATFTKKIPSLLSNWFGRTLTGLQLHDSGCSLKAYRRSALKDLTLFGEMHRFIPAILYTKGFRISEIKVAHHPRKFGRTKYNFSRLLKGFLDLLYIKFWSSFSTRPLHLFGLIGFTMMGIAGLIALIKVLAYVIYLQPIEVTAALLLAALMAIMGLQFIVFGFLGEIQVRTYYNTANEKEYEIEKIA